jgi:GNAT superfamily N-acetyltransferase
MLIRPLTETELTPALFAGFHRHQVTTRCKKKIDGVWREVDSAFEDEDWDADDLIELTGLLRQILAHGGVLFGAFEESGVLKGFSAVDGRFSGSAGQYLDLVWLHVSEDLRGRGIGKALFQRSAEWAFSHGAKKLYISAHSSLESQAFYAAMGCMEAEEYDQTHTKNEPGACQLEYVLGDAAR